jgi:hypothetical protein
MSCDKKQRKISLFLWKSNFIVRIFVHSVATVNREWVAKPARHPARRQATMMMACRTQSVRFGTKESQKAGNTICLPLNMACCLMDLEINNDMQRCKVSTEELTTCNCGDLMSSMFTAHVKHTTTLAKPLVPVQHSELAVNSVVPCFFHNMFAPIVGSSKGMKRATQRLKKLNHQQGETNCIPSDACGATLKTCAQDRMHGARATESTHKIMEDRGGCCQNNV